MKTLTDQQKLEILCAYLPHGVEVEINLKIAGDNYPDEIRRKKLTADNIGSLLSLQGKPILRHPDDMTDEEAVELTAIIGYEFVDDKRWVIDFFIKGFETIVVQMEEIKQALNYLHSIHVDTFNAIEAGFAVRKIINEKG